MPPEPQKIQALFEAAKPTLLALPQTLLVRPRVTRERALQLTTPLLEAFSPLLPALTVELSAARAAEREADFKSLETHALVYYAAELAVEVPWTSEQKAQRTLLVQQVKAHDDELSAWAVPAFKHNAQASETLADIRRGRGIRDDAEDTVRLVGLYRENWASVQGTIPITTQYLEKADADATALLLLLDGDGEDTTGSPRDLRRRAYTQWQRAYHELLHLGRYLTRNDANANAKFLAISTVRTAPAPTSPGEVVSPG